MDELNGTSRQELIAVIRQVRNRWRLKLLLKGGLIVIVGALLAVVLASLGLQSYKFSPASVTGLRIAVFGAFALLAVLWLVLPMRRRVNDMQVALYVEEHEPSLQAAILSAVDVSGPVGPDQAPVPPAIVEKMVAQAIEKCRTIEGGKSIGRQTLRRLTVALTSAAALVALLLSIGPEFLRQGASALLVLSTSASAASPYAITVEPGDVNVPKGSDQSIKARLAGFRTNEVMLMVKEAGSDKIDRRPLVVTGDVAIFEGMLFDLKSSIEYYVEADGVKSPTYTMAVVELPAVSNLELEYIYPAYTGLAPQKLASGGDVAALRGTEVRVKITSTMATPGGRLLFDPGNPSGLTTQADGTLTGSFTIGEDGYYHVELTGPRGEKVMASPKFTIDAIEDQPPTVAIEKPRRDIQANPVEEVYIKAKADDDYGVRQLDLVYSVNGGAEKTATLYGKGAKALTEVSGAHTIYLEELGVKAGDFVSYYAVARDSDTVKGPKATSSDIYFVQIRPFGQNFREAQSQAGGGGGGGGGGGRGNQPGALSEQQRQVISATFNVNRDKTKNSPDKVKEDTKFVELSQERLRTEVESLVQTMRQRLGGGAGENIQRIVDLLPKAAEEMKAAEAMLRDQKTKEALAPEQRALKHLQDAEQAYELEVRRQQQGGGGGGGGGGGQMASELADLFQLQLDRQANQYEQQQRSQQQNADQQIDELAERLRELARRQLQQAEQQRRQRGQQQSQSGGGSGQRALADEVEQMARQLEQLRRDAERQGQQRPDLADAAKRLQESANSMRQAAASGQDGGAQAQQAYQRLQDAAKMLENNQAQQSGQNVRDLQRKADDLARQQKDVSQRVAGLDKAGDQRDQQARQLAQEKDEMRGKVADIEQQLGNLSRQALASNQRDAARKLQEAAGSIRDNMLKEKMEYSKSAMTGGAEYTKPIEAEIGSNIEQLRQKLGEAAAAADAAQQGQGLNRASNNMRNLSRDLNSFGEQLDQALGQQGQQQGQQGQGQQQGEKGGQQGQGEKGQGQGQGEKGQGQGQGEKGQGQGEKGQGQGQGQGEKGQGQGQGEKGQGQGQGQGQGGEKGGGQQGRGQGSQRLDEGGRGGDGKEGSGKMTGNPAPQGSRNASGDARPELNQGQIRQWTNQANELANDAADVRRQLQQAGVNPRDLTPVDEVVKALRALGDAKAYNDPNRLQDLYSTALEKFKALEYEVRKKVDTTNEQLFLSGSDEVPPKYKDLIQEYYRALSKKGGKDK